MAKKQVNRADKKQLNQSTRKAKKKLGAIIGEKSKVSASSKIRKVNSVSKSKVLSKEKSKEKSKGKSNGKSESDVKKANYKVNTGDLLSIIPRESTAGRDFALESLDAKFLVLYFYPRDNTPGCTTEGQDFARLYKEFKTQNAEVVGVSRDSLRSHVAFKSKYNFPFELVSDGDEKLCRAFDVIHLKSLYGRKFEGIERSTFLLQKKNTGQVLLLAAWRKLKVTGHAQEVLDFIKSGKK